MNEAIFGATDDSFWDGPCRLDGEEVLVAWLVDFDHGERLCMDGIFEDDTGGLQPVRFIYPPFASRVKHSTVYISAHTEQFKKGNYLSLYAVFRLYFGVLILR
jgi:hypothetical protein